MWPFHQIKKPVRNITQFITQFPAYKNPQEKLFFSLNTKNRFIYPEHVFIFNSKDM